MKNLAKAVIAVMKDVKGMEKNSSVGTGRNSYNGTKDQDVKEVFNDALAKHGLCIMPTEVNQEVQVDRWEHTDQYGTKQKQSVFTQVTTKYLLLHDSGESIELAGAGHGVDAQDKGEGKALTYALKNTLLYTFLTPVGKIDDTETTHSNDVQAPKKVALSKKVSKPTGKPVLTQEGFEHYSTKGTAEEITQVLEKREVTDLQKSALLVVKRQLTK